MRAKIYVEGGGPGPLFDTLFRQSWHAFFEAAGLAGRMPRIVRGQSREKTYDRFLTAVRHPRRDELPLLLVDSEGPVQRGRTVWQHLKAQDGWDPPAGTAEDQSFLMVQVMETWFVADRDLLRLYFGSTLRDKYLREWPELESVPKSKVLAALEKATGACPRPYSKGKAAAEILAQLDPQKVEAKCPHAKALLDRLRTL